MIARFLFVGVALLLLLGASVAFGDGAYQRTKNGRTTVWNDDPKPGEEATWAGDRDSEGYATGFGTLTWYTGEKQSQKRFGIPLPKSATVYARYYGRMIRGKFDGPVNVHSKDKTANAVFVDGERTTRWIVGRALSRRVTRSEVRDPAPAGKPPSKARDQRSEVKRQTSEAGGLATAGKLPSESSSPPPAPSVAEKREEPVREQAKSEAEAPAEEAPVPTPEVASPTSDAKGQTSTNGASGRSDIHGGLEPRPETSVAAESEPGTSVPRSEARVPVTAGKLPSEANRPSTPNVPKPPTKKKSQTEVENSLRALVGPPSSLHETPTAPAGDARLTKEQVIDLADRGARARGYDPAGYRRAEPQYSVADKTWSLSYGQSEGAEEGGRTFTVIVDDKTKGTVFVPGK